MTKCLNKRSAGLEYAARYVALGFQMDDGEKLILDALAKADREGWELVQVQELRGVANPKYGKPGEPYFVNGIRLWLRRMRSEQTKRSRSKL